MKKSLEQFYRMKRWQNRIVEIDEENRINDDPKYFEDCLYAFYENCWHLKDWIINSNELDRNIVEDFFHNDQFLRICQSLATGSKHLTTNSKHVKKIRVFHPRRPGTNEIFTFNVLADYGKVISAVELVNVCVKKCGDFLVKHKVIR